MEMECQAQMCTERIAENKNCELYTDMTNAMLGRDSSLLQSQKCAHEIMKALIQE